MSLPRLPREIRDIIYSNLVTVEDDTQTPDARNRPDDIAECEDLIYNQPYDFSHLADLVNINTTLGVEALETLLSHGFVLIHDRSLWLRELVKAFQVPVVKVGLLNSIVFDHWTMKLDISIPHSRDNFMRSEYNPSDMVILAKDMPLFCRALRWAFLGYEQTATMILPDPDQALLYKYLPPNDNGRALLDIQLRSATNEGVSSSLTPARENSLLEPLLQCFCGDLAISVRGTLGRDEYWKQRLTDAMAPREIWMSAMAWQLLDAMADAHSLIRQLYAEGRMIQIYNLVHFIAEQVRTCSLIAMLQESDDEELPESLEKEFVSGISEPLTRAIIIEYDMFAYAFCAGLRSYDVEATFGMLDFWARWRNDYTDDFLERARYLRIPLLPILNGDLAHPCDDWMETVCSAIECLERVENRPVHRLAANLLRLNHVAVAFPDNQIYQSHTPLLYEVWRTHNDVRPSATMVRALLNDLCIDMFDVDSLKTISAYNYRIQPQMKGLVDTAEQALVHERQTVFYDVRR